MVFRRAALAMSLAAFCLCAGCTGNTEKDKNPNPSLEYSKEGPPKRSGTSGGPEKPK